MAAEVQLPFLRATSLQLFGCCHFRSAAFASTAVVVVVGIVAAAVAIVFVVVAVSFRFVKFPQSYACADWHGVTAEANVEAVVAVPTIVLVELVVIATAAWPLIACV